MVAFDNLAIANKALENADSSPATDFWLAIVVSAYQPYGPGDNFDMPPSSADGDPDVRYHIHSSAWSTGDLSVTLAETPSTGQNAVLFFLEASIDGLRQDAAGYTGIPAHPLSFLEPQTIGHVFGLPDVGPGSLMGPYDGADPDFNAVEIAQIRNSNDPASH